jgi:Ca-activated chloride channel homolog
MIAEVGLCCLMDVSNSMDDQEYRLQMQGTADALVHEHVVRAVESRQGVAICLIQWAQAQRMVLPWTLLRTREDCERVARVVAAISRADVGLFTGVKLALAAALTAFEAVTVERQVVDISLDGVDNIAVSADPRMDLIQMGTQINAIPILDTTSSQGPALNHNLLSYTRGQLISPNGIMVVAEDFEDYGRAMVRKLNSEIS